MPKLKETLIRKTGLLLSSAALATAVKTSGATCIFSIHQPKEPKGLEKFKKS